MIGATRGAGREGEGRSRPEKVNPPPEGAGGMSPVWHAPTSGANTAYHGAGLTIVPIVEGSCAA